MHSYYSSFVSLRHVCRPHFWTRLSEMQDGPKSISATAELSINCLPVRLEFVVKKSVNARIIISLDIKYSMPDPICDVNYFKWVSFNAPPRAMVSGWFYWFNPRPPRKVWKNWPVLSQSFHVSKNLSPPTLVAFATLMAFGHSFVRPHIEPPYKWNSLLWPWLHPTQYRLFRRWKLLCALRYW